VDEKVVAIVALITKNSRSYRYENTNTRLSAMLYHTVSRNAPPRGEVVDIKRIPEHDCEDQKSLCSLLIVPKVI
jgi:hypothetical protein